MRLRLVWGTTNYLYDDRLTSLACCAHGCCQEGWRHDAWGQDRGVGADSMGDLHNPWDRTLPQGVAGVRRSEYLSPLYLPVDQIDGDHHLNRGYGGALHRIHPDSTGAPDRDRLPGKHAGAVDGNTPSGGDRTVNSQ